MWTRLLSPFACACLLCCGGPAETESAPARVVALSAGDHHSCALFEGGAVKCWGGAEHGQVGLGDNDNRGDDPGEMGSALPTVNLGQGRRALSVAAGGGHTCAVLDDATMKCWGSAYAGRNGRGDEYDHRGDQPGEMGDDLAPLGLGAGARVLQVSTGFAHSCALLEGGAVKCWGHGAFGQLGNGDLEHRGDQAGEMGDALPFLSLGDGEVATAVAAAADHSCALLEGGAVKCWGAAFSGRLGSGDSLDNLGDEPGEMGDALPPVDLGGDARPLAISAGGGHTCVLLEGGAVKCWGGNPRGQLGTGDTDDRGDTPSEMGDALEAVDLGGERALAVAAGGNHTCALLEGGAVKCFGASLVGVLGQGQVTAIGSSETPTAHLGDEPGEMGIALPEVDLGRGRTALAISAGTRHTCPLLDDGAVKCWGEATDGQLGLGDTQTRGDEPGEMGDALPALRL